MDSNIEFINPDDLSFDFENPRIAEFNPEPDISDIEIIKILWNVMGVEEIVLSIKASGFFNHEPLIAIKENLKSIVIEGNRRLAAIKCILNPDLLGKIGVSKNIAKIDSAKREQLKRIPVIFVSNRQDAWRFIGFKHINGPAKWGSYAKAQYISQIKREFNIPLDVIANQIGDTHNTVQKLYQGLQIIEQAEKWKIFDRKDIKSPRLYFSHLYTAITYDSYRDFIGLSIEDEGSVAIPEDKKDNLEELLLWIYGSRSKNIVPIIQSQNPDLRRLESVLKSKEATYALKAGIELSQAFELSQPKSNTFDQSLLDAKRAIQKAQSFVTEGFDPSDLTTLKLAGSIANMADDLYKGMENKYREFNGEKPTRISE